MWQFEQQLGRGATATWRALCAQRDDHAEVCTTIQLLVGRGQTDRLVRAGLARLTKLGVVLTKRTRDRRTGRRVRVVYGVECGRQNARSVRLPAEVADKVCAAPHWGGERRGKPAKNKGVQVSSVAVGSSPVSSVAVGVSSVAVGVSSVAVGEAAAARQVPPSVGGGDKSAPSYGGRTHSRARPQFNLQLRVEAPVSSRPEAAPTSVAAGGSSFGGARRSVATWLYPGVPCEPTLSAVPPVVMPGPPLLQDDEPLGAQVEFVAATWEHAVVHHFGGKKRSVFRRRGGVLGSAYFDAMADAVAAFAEHEIPPAAWLAFSFAIWGEHHKPNGKKAKPPPLKWAFDATRVSERRGWFRNATSSLGGNVVFTPPHRQLVQRHAVMRMALLRLVDPPAESVRQVVDRYFPGQLYTELVGTARAESKTLKSRLRCQAERGEWLW